VIFLLYHTNTLTLFFNPFYRIEEKAKISDAIVKHDEDKLGVTRALQHKLDEKLAKINKYE